MSFANKISTYWKWVAALLLLLLGIVILIWATITSVHFGGKTLLGELGLHLVLGTIAGLLVLILLAVLIVRYRDVRAERLKAEASEDEYGKLRRGLERGLEAILDTLKRTKRPLWGDRTYKYLLPWYLVTGPTGAGKTSLLRASGQRMPTAEQRDKFIAVGSAYSLSLSDNAVFIETAGPFGGQLDNRLWTAFLAQLKRLRAYQPLNGVILTFDLADFRTAPQARVAALAEEVRQHLGELQNRLGVCPPIYVVFTRLDEAPGFQPFFRGAPRIPRDGVLGLTLPPPGSESEPGEDNSIAKQVSRAFDDLLKWQLPRMLERVHVEATPDARFDAFMFLPEIASFKGRLLRFVEAAFTPGQLDEKLLLRGVYFTSAQPNLEAADLSRPMLAAPDGAPNEGLFIRDLIEKVIIPEAGLAGLNERVQRMVRRFRIGFAGAGAILSLMLSLWWAVSFVDNNHLIQDVREGLDQVRTALSVLGDRPENRRLATDIAMTLPVLESLADLPTGWNEREMPTPPREKGGLSQRTALAHATQEEYLQGLRVLLLPRLFRAMEVLIRQNLAEPAELYRELMVYLMFGGEHPIDKEFVQRALARRCSLIYPGPEQAPLCNRFNTQVGNLLTVGFKPLPVDADLVRRARLKLNDFSPAQRGMAILADMPEIAKLPVWRLSDVIGPLGPTALTRRSGKSLSEGVSGLYTATAFSDTAIPLISKVAERVVREDWVRFPDSDKTPSPLAVDQLRQEITSLYVHNYVQVWEDILNDVAILPFTNFGSELTILQSLLGPPSPMEAFLQGVSKQTSFPPVVATIGKQEPGAVIAQVTQANGDMVAPTQSITDHFRTLHSFVSGNPSSLNELMKLLNQLRSIIGPVATFGPGDPARMTDLTATPALTQTLNQLQMSVMAAPPPVADNILTLVRETSAITNTGVRNDLNATWRKQLLPFCQSAINGRYPFARSDNDVTIADFTRMFATDGLLDQFFNRYLKPFVDTSSTPWKLLANAGPKLDVTPSALHYFEQAARIRTIFFPGGAREPRISFGVTPTELDPQAMGVTLDVGGQALIYQYGVQQTVTMQWPAPSSGARVSFGATEPGQPSFLPIEGPWALFRLLQREQFKQLGPTRFALTVKLGARTASFGLEAATIDNPFKQDVLQGFKCLPFLVPG